MDRMFGRNIFSDFETDPFFSPHKDRFDHFFNHDPFQAALPEPAREEPRPNVEHAVERRDRHRDWTMPFSHSLVHNVFSNFDRAVDRAFQGMDQLQNDPNAHCYTHSSVSTYHRGEDGQPKYFEATNSTRAGPDGVKETRKTLRDSEKELAKMAVGHHIGDRAHVIEKSCNTRTGHEEEKQNFINMEQGDAAAFDEEWQSKTRHFYGHALPDAKNREGKRALKDSCAEESSKKVKDSTRKKDSKEKAKDSSAKEHHA